jgi:hypothetical protein
MRLRLYKGNEGIVIAVGMLAIVLTLVVVLKLILG